MGSWYYKKGPDDIGPLSDKELAQAYLSGIFGGDTPVRREELERWSTFNKFKSYEKLKNYKRIKNEQSTAPLHPDNGDTRADESSGAEPDGYSETKSPPLIQSEQFVTSSPPDSDEIHVPDSDEIHVPDSDEIHAEFNEAEPDDYSETNTHPFTENERATAPLHPDNGDTRADESSGAEPDGYSETKSPPLIQSEQFVTSSPPDSDEIHAEFNEAEPDDYSETNTHSFTEDERVTAPLHPDNGDTRADESSGAKPDDYSETNTRSFIEDEQSTAPSHPDNGDTRADESSGAEPDGYSETNTHSFIEDERATDPLHPDNGDTRAGSNEGRLGEYSNMQFSSDDDADEEINLAEYWHVIARHKWGIGGMVFVCALIGALTAFSIKPTYRAAVTMLVEPEHPKIVSLEHVPTATDIMFFYETQYDVIRSRSIAEAVIHKLKLYDNPEFTEKGSNPFVFNWKDWIPKQWASYFKEWGIHLKPLNQEQISEEIEADMQSRRNQTFSMDTQPGAETARISLPARIAEAKLFKRFHDRLSIGSEKNSQIVAIKFDSYDPQLAADIANTVAKAYMELGLESRLSVVKQATSWLTARLVDLRRKLAASEKALQDFQVREGVIDTKSRQSITSKRLSGITGQLVKAQATLIETEIRYNQVVQIRRNGGSYDTLRSVLKNVFIQNLKEEEARLMRKVGELEERYGEKHPKIIAAKSDLKEAQSHLKLEIGKVVEGIKREYEVAKENERRLRTLSEKIKSQIRKNTGREFELAKLERNVATNRQLYGIFLTRSKETNVEGNNNITNVRIIDHARPPIRPVKPKKTLITFFTLFLGLFMGVSLAFVRDYLDNTFKDPDDVERELRLPVMGAIPLMGKNDMERFLAKREFLTKFQEPFTEVIRNIRTSILFSNLDHPPKTILVTSAVPSEGKTTLSCSIALSFSQIGRTLLVEADLRKPAQAKMMALDESLGLASIISGQATIEEAVVTDPVYKNMNYLAGKVSSSSPLEILSSRKFSSMLTELKARFDYIVIDTAPIVMFSDALVISHLADCLLMVVKADSTSHSLAHDALKRFRAIHLRPTGVVLTNVNMRDLSVYGSAYYNYGSYVNDDSA